MFNPFLVCLLYSVFQVFCGRIPNSVFEDSLIPLFEKCGTIWDLRLMMDPSTGLNKTFCFVMFTSKDGAQKAVKQVRLSQHINIFVTPTSANALNIPKN